MKQILTQSDIKQLGTILGVWAHPDDESFLSAGIMATAVMNGQKIMCVTATKGEKGSDDTAEWALGRVGEVRANEMAAALKVLGVQAHQWLDFADGGCEGVDQDAAVSRIQKIINDFKPDTILTFGPEGLTGHPDHQCVSRWATAAAHSMGTKVYHAVHTNEQYENYLKEADEKLNIFFNIDKPPLVEVGDCAIAFELPPAICDKKCDAVAAMPSQTEIIARELGRDFIKRAFAAEYFVAAK